MRKPDELALYDALRARSHVVGDGPFAVRSPGSIYALQEEAARLGIPEKRAFALVEKWSARGWWEYGVSLRGGWFTPEAPEALTP
jgi:hypothetical protein